MCVGGGGGVIDVKAVGMRPTMQYSSLPRCVRARIVMSWYFAFGTGGVAGTTLLRTSSERRGTSGAGGATPTDVSVDRGCLLVRAGVASVGGGAAALRLVARLALGAVCVLVSGRCPAAYAAARRVADRVFMVAGVGCRVSGIGYRVSNREGA